MPDYEQTILISYAWGGEREEIVNQIDEALQKRGVKITRDKRDLGYKGSIKEFMELIGRGNCVIVVISDKYLRSPNCMFELVEIAEGKQFHDRIFPVVLSDANIYDPIKRIKYVKYWEVKRAELADAMRTLDPANLQGIRDDMDLYDRIRDEISGLTSTLKDMNTLTPDMHRDADFAQLYNALIERMQSTPVATSTKPDSASPSNENPKPKKERKPMDPITLATAATSLLAPFIKKAGAAALDKIAEQLPDTVGKMWNAITNKSESITDAASDLAKNPDDADNEVFLKKQLQKALEKDQEFASLLNDLVEQAKSESGDTVGGDKITVSANNNSTAVGKISVGGNVGGNFTIGNNNQVNNK